MDAVTAGYGAPDTGACCRLLQLAEGYSRLRWSLYVNATGYCSYLESLQAGVCMTSNSGDNRHDPIAHLVACQQPHYACNERKVEQGVLVSRQWQITGKVLSTT